MIASIRIRNHLLCPNYENVLYIPGPKLGSLYGSSGPFLGDFEKEYARLFLFYDVTYFPGLLWIVS